MSVQEPHLYGSTTLKDIEQNCLVLADGYLLAVRAIDDLWANQT
ncbi:hypothetical protein VSR82_23095 [Burkholderia sp. JPY481]